jgi:hypothetical protein
MKFQVSYTNELPFLVELQDEKYEIMTQYGIYELQLNSKWYKVHTARFAEHAGKGVYVGEKEELENILDGKEIANYAFDNCKTFVSCRMTIEKEITEEDLNSVTDENTKEKLKSKLIANGTLYESIENLNEITLKEFNSLDDDAKTQLRLQIVYDNIFSGLNNIFGYYEALNKLISHYADTRNFFWIQKLNENTMEGTNVTEYVGGVLYNSYTHAGLVPSILPYKRKYPDISQEDMDILKEKLKTGAEVPVERRLILVARSLWYRMEYRSAIIEASAALEYVVEKKLIEKMTGLGKTSQFIKNELKNTEMDFTNRCNKTLRIYTGQSFIADNAVLWSKVRSHRKKFRNPIAHSNIEPDKKMTEEIINDFETAINYVNTL